MIAESQNKPRSTVSFEICRAAGEPTLKHTFELNPDGSVGKRIGEPMEVSN